MRDYGTVKATQMDSDRLTGVGQHIDISPPHDNCTINLHVVRTVSDRLALFGIGYF